MPRYPQSPSYHPPSIPYLSFSVNNAYLKTIWKGLYKWQQVPIGYSYCLNVTACVKITFIVYSKHTVLEMNALLGCCLGLL